MEFTPIQTSILMVFILNGLAHLANDYFKPKNEKIIKIITKSLIVPLSLIFYAISDPNPEILVIIGLIFGWFGDIFLLKKSEKKMFILGLLSFLIGHLFYISAFMISTDFSRPFYVELGLLIVIYLVYLALMLRTLNDFLGRMKVPVVVYSIILVLMSISAFIYSITSYSGSNTIVLLTYVGSLLFLISDSLIAYYYFKKPQKYNNILIMATYIAAQMLIPMGFLA